MRFDFQAVLITLALGAGLAFGQSAPVISAVSASPPGISQTLAPLSGGAFTLTLRGQNFEAGSQVSMGGTVLATTFVSATEVTATVPAGSLLTAGTAAIKVTNPGNAISNSIDLRVVERGDVNGTRSINIGDALATAINVGGISKPAFPNTVSDINLSGGSNIGDALVLALFAANINPNMPAPAVTSVTPGPAVRGNALTINGTGFSSTASEMRVLFTTSNGVLRIVPSTSSPATMTVTVPSNAVSGAIQIFRTDTPTGSPEFPIVVSGTDTPLILTSISPFYNLTGGSSITLAGLGFDPAPANNTVSFRAAGGTVAGNVTAASSTSLTVTVPATALCGAVAVTVGSATSNARATTVISETACPVQLVDILGGGAPGDIVVLEVTGADSGVPSNNVVKFTTASGTADALVLQSGKTALTVRIPAGAVEGNVTLTVGGQTSPPLVYRPIPAPDAPTLSAIDPVSGTAGTAVNVTVTGTNFINGATQVGVSGSGIAVGAVTVNNASSLSTTLTLAGAATPGARSLTVTTPGGTSGALTFTVIAPAIATVQFLDSANAVTKELVVKEGGTLQVQLKIVDAAGNTRTDVVPSYSSIDTDIATINSSGIITGVRFGYSTVTATAGGTIATGTISVAQVTTGVSGVDANAIALDQARRLYLALSQDHTIRVAEDLSQEPQIYAGTAQTPGLQNAPRLQSLFRNPAFLAIDNSEGSLYVSDSANHVIRRVRPGTSGVVETFAGTGAAGSQNGSRETAQFNNPQGIALDSAGNLWVADAGNHTIRRITLATGVVDTIAGLAGTPGSADGAGTQALFNGPAGLAIEPETLSQQLDRFRRGGAPGGTRLIVADKNNGLIRRVRSTGEVETLAFTGSTLRSIERSKSAREAYAAITFTAPASVAVDALGAVYVAETNGKVKVVLPGGEVVAALPPNTVDNPKGIAVGQGGQLIVTGGNRSAVEVRFGVPEIANFSPVKAGNKGGTEITIHGRNFSPDTIVVLGGVLVTNAQVLSTQTIRMTTPVVASGVTTLTVQNRGGLVQRPYPIEPDTLSALAAGRITTVAGGSTFVGDGSPASSSSVAPWSATVDRAGNIYIADTGHHRIRRVDGVTGIISTVAGIGNATFAGDNGPATAASLNTPTGVAVDGAGNLYIADTSNHRIRKVAATTGIITTVAGTGESGTPVENVAATSSPLANPAGVAVDGNGNLFIADSDNNRIRKVSASTGVIVTYAGTDAFLAAGDGGPATAAAFDPQGIAMDSAGNVFIVDSFNNRIRKITASTGIVTTVASGLSGPNGVAVDSSGNVFIADTGNRRIRRVTSGGGVSTIAGTGVSGSTGDNGTASAATFVDPYGVTVDSAGNILVSDLGAYRLRKIDGRTGVIATFAGDGQLGYPGDDGPATAAGLNFPAGVAADLNGNLFISDSDRVRKLTASTGTITTYVPGSQLKGPTALATDSSGNLYIADSDNHRILKVTPAGAITTIAGTTGTAGFSPTLLNSPLGLVLDGQGNLLIADTGNSRVRKLNLSTGVLTAVAGNGQFDFTGDGGQATAAALNFPIGVALDSAGNIYIADTLNSRIRKVTVSTGIMTTVAGNGTLGFSGDNGSATAAALNFPIGVAVDSGGNVYIADTFNSRIRKIASGAISTVIGNGTFDSAGDNGSASAATVALPITIAFDASGNLMIADAHPIARIRVVKGAPN